MTDVHAGAGSAGTVKWSDVTKIDGRPVAYVAEGIHGLWPTATNNVYVNVRLALFSCLRFNTADSRSSTFSS
jgi:hypothetical protein